MNANEVEARIGRRIKIETDEAANAAIERKTSEKVVGGTKTNEAVIVEEMNDATKTADETAEAPIATKKTDAAEIGMSHETMWTTETIGKRDADLALLSPSGEKATQKLATVLTFLFCAVSGHQPRLLPSPPVKSEKTSSYGGLALKDKKHKKVEKSKSVKKPPPPPAPPANDSSKDAIERRQERLRLWREQQKQKEEENTVGGNNSNVEGPDAPPAVAGFVVDEDVVQQVHMWPIDEKDDKEPDHVSAISDDPEIDPLDAFMADLGNSSSVVIEQRNLELPKAKVISFEDIMSKNKEVDFYGSFLPPNNALLPASIYPPKQPDETEEERDAREKAELEEFMRAIKAKREREEAVNKEGIIGAAEDIDDDLRSTVMDKKADTGRIYQGVEEDAIGEEMANNVDSRTALEILQEQQKKKEIRPVDHKAVDYIPFRKKFYIEPADVANQPQEEVDELLKSMEIKIRGKGCPRPIQKWTQTGLSQRLQKLIARQEYPTPFAIQCQALPAIMSGRDVIGIAKTGSGKTLAFLLPMFRHILDQPPLADGEGPIGLVMAPARELVQQIYIESKKFTKDLALRSTAVYGGSSVSEQIANLKRGSDIVICTPGRMIDILTMSAGKMVSLKRVTYVVLDEADRMFDMGFEPQITKIMMNIRADRQTLLFSATFPRSVESLARKVLKKPIEITVGARSTASGDIKQYAEVREESDKFMRLLQLLGMWYEKGNVLVFVNTQQACDQIFQDLMKAGYMALSLHGGKDQVDRDYTVDDFKRKVRTLMVATSVAGRGLDVKDLVLVINYHCPNHLEDYVHRVGRTGRAGRKGTAYTFISPQEEEYAPDLVKALENAKQEVPPELRALSDQFKEKVRTGLARYHGSGFKGKGFTFDESEKSEAQRAADYQKRQYEMDEGLADAGDDDDDDESPVPSAKPTTSAPEQSEKSIEEMTMAEKMNSFKERARMVANMLVGEPSQKEEIRHFRDELEINDYPQQARWKVLQKESSDLVAEITGAAVIRRGTYVAPGRKPNVGERKLYLAIEAGSRQAVAEAKRELQRILDEKTMEVGISDDRKYGKYSI
ncbi:hypothetical protein H310_09968 [Aphanomyces invadans]|uniref:RNA helicase n=1 Tax=Aphanomyces invadans TaxID=157072 RepID=A0A024TSN9_9STRA|nr:hypothetical protein H310_09968 [Aphanomyces invadans]ETV97170.1 hypothetical protein H310_09968 [Aphanomyces invadans]|eukprot:XP_008874416.1 hypothetical protein H310_09968 [Aphanomyces invadans]